MVTRRNLRKAGGRMSNAIDKNQQALRALFGNDTLAARLSATRLAVVLPSQELPASGSLLTDALADTLARLWPNIDFYGCAAHRAHGVAVEAAVSGDVPADGLHVRWSPPYDLVVAVGCDVPPDAGTVLRLGADGWTAAIGEHATCGANNVPVGPAFAAAVGGAQVFSRIFQHELADSGAQTIDDWHVDVRDLFGCPELSAGPLDLNDVHFFGVGAVTHGLMWLMERWPHAVTGRPHLVDLDTFGGTNGQRYAFMKREYIGQRKVEVMKARLHAAHSGLDVQPHALDLNAYCAQRGYDLPLHRVVTGLDSAEARRQAALKLPGRVINMWTGGQRVGVGRYAPGGGRACLFCGYLERVDVAVDEVGELHQQTGLRPDIIRGLLDSGRGLTDDEANTLAGRWGVAAQSLVAQPLRSAMPVVCATGRLQLPNNPEAIDVPFAFASALAGAAGFMMLVQDLSDSAGASTGWVPHIFKQPTTHLLQDLPSRPECVCCEAMTSLFDLA